MKLHRDTIVTVLASYCGERGCTDRLPCRLCMEMCNTFKLENDVDATYRGQVVGNNIALICPKS